MPTPNNPFEQIIIPTEIPSAWPPAPIYWVIFAAIVFIFVISIWFIKRRIKKQQTIKKALSALAQLQQSKTTSFVQLNELLKGLCLHYYPRQQVASLTGETWFYFLQQHHVQKNNPLFNNADEFCQRLYKIDASCSAQDFQLAKQWIKHFPAQVVALQKSTNNSDHYLAGKQHV
jgi:hypothetical protein